MLEKTLETAGRLKAVRPKRRSAFSQALKAISEGVVRDSGVVKSDPVVRPIQNARELDEVHRLTHDAYLERGYCTPQPNGRLAHYPHLDVIPETTVLVAVQNGEIVGTNSWTMDGPNGLHVDSDFKPECDAIRREGRRVASAWRIATRSICRGERTVVMEMIRQTIRGCLVAGASTCVFTFNPRHERIYQRLLNMETVARSTGTKGLTEAPAVFMRLDKENIPARWRERCGV